MGRHTLAYPLPLLIASAAMVWVAAGGRAAEAGHAAFYNLGGAYARLLAEAPVPLVGVPEQRMAIAAIVPDEDGTGLVALGCSGRSGRMAALLRVRPGAGYVPDVSPPPDSICMAYALVRTAGGIFVGTDRGLLLVEGPSAACFDRFVGVHRGSFIEPGAEPVHPAARELVADREGNVWAAGSAPVTRAVNSLDNPIMFPSDRGRWLTAHAGQALDRPYPRLFRWRAPVAAMAGDPLHAGVWVYGAWAGEKSDLMHVDPIMAGALPVRDPTSAVPAGVAVPAVSEPLLTADLQGRVWLAGDTLGGWRVYVFDGKTFAEVTPPAALLRARRLTQLLTDPKGVLYAATDGVGLLTYEGKEWRAHPINDHLPTLEGTELKPVSCMCLDTEGNLWIGTDNNVVCWREGR